MKNLLQKALAVWLSVVTVLGVSTPALAADGNNVGSGSVSGKVFSFEGPMPEDVIEIQMPTEREGMFDFILDPSGAIMATEGARYKSQYGDEVTFDSGKVFFQNVTTDANGTPHVSYSNRSDSLLVKNLSNVPVDVVMTLEVKKGAYDFEFAPNPDFTDANGSTIGDASMYMALVTAKRTGAVVPVDDGGTEKYRATVTSWLAPPEDAFRIVWDGEKNAYRYQLKPGLPDSLFDSTSFYVTGALGEGVWDGVEGEITLDISWSVVPTKSEAIENPFEVPGSSPYLQSVTYAYRDGDTAKIVVDFGSMDGAMTTISGIHYTMEDGSTGFVSADNMTISPYPENEFQSLAELTVSGDLFEAVSWSLELSDDNGNTVDLPLELVLDITKPMATVIRRTATTAEKAEIRVNWGIMKEVSGITYTTDADESATIPADAITLDKPSAGIGSQSTLSVALDNDALLGSGFTLILTNDDGETVEISDLDLSSYALDPTVTNVQQATASSPAAVVTVNWGAGSKKMSAVSKATYTTPENTEAEIDASNFTRDGNAITVRFDEESIKGSNFTLFLTNSKGARYPLSVSDLVEPVDPSATVVQGAEASNRYLAKMTMDWGIGVKAMNKVTKVTYLNSSDATVEITNITADGNTVNVQFEQDVTSGHDFVATLTNDRGETKTLNVNFLVSPVPAALRSVTHSASAVGEFATIEVDWGAGSQAMSDVSTVTYTKASGAPGTVNADDITVVGDTISIRIDEDSVKGTNFEITLKNYLNQDGTPIALDGLLEEKDPTATVASDQKATAVGDSAAITVSWGSGAKAMTAVSNVTYTKISGGEGTITGSNITVDGDTVSVTFDADSIRGKDFKLVLNRNGGTTKTLDVDLVNASDPTVAVATKASASGESATMTVNWGSGTKAMSGVSKVTYTDVSGEQKEITGSANITVSDNTASVKFDKDSIRGTNFKVVLTNGTTDKVLNDVLDLVEASDPTVEVTRKASASDESATITVNWGAGSKAMSGVSKVEYTNVSNASATIAGSAITVDNNTVTVPFDEPSIKGTNFKLVLSRGATTKSFDVDLVNASDPTVSVTRQANASGDTATATLTWGTGSKAMAAFSKVTYTTVNGTAATIAAANATLSGNTLSVKFDDTSIKGSNFEVVLTKPGGGSIEVAADLANYEEPASATVTKKATAPGQSATITVSWGVGSQMMNAVKQITYTDASGKAAVIDSSNINVKGSTITVKFDRNSIQGKNFKLVLTNGSRDTDPFTLDLAAFDTSAGLPAEANVTKKATSSSRTATILVDWGSGEAAMTSVVKITYKQTNGSSAEIKSGSYLKTDGNTVTVRFTSVTIKGTDFVLVLKNDSGATLEIPVDLIET